MNKIGIYGGTFDPLHKGHLSLARSAVDEMKLDKLIFLPAYIQPFKKDYKYTKGEHRVKMIELAISEYEKFQVSDYEIRKKDISYSYDTLSELRNMVDGKIYFVMGDDSFVQLENWYKGKELLENYSFIVGSRPGIPSDITEEYTNIYREKYSTEIYLINNKLVDISATELRKALKTGKDVDKFLVDPVTEYINENKLYR
ncbi:MAG TPA: nicotinate (nicotinamide) nucleotide adenylyltransferase [Anaerovoracaceae bacterium]|nr:nicotinate (nicotinamide) nucleotide adenylyltransferase [Anaerovoracaceae bacterium]